MKPIRTATGFTLIELMIVIAIIASLATMAVPSFQDRVIRTQVSEGLGLAEFAKQAVASQFAKTHSFAKNNLAAGLPPADHIVGNYVSAIEVKDGALLLTFGNQSNRNLAGKRLSLRPATVDGYPQVPISWVCGTAIVPEKMTAHGVDETSMPAIHLPLDCRPGVAAALVK